MAWSSFSSVLEKHEQKCLIIHTLTLIFICDDDHYYHLHTLSTLLFYEQLFKDAVIGFRGWRIREDLKWGVKWFETFWHIVETNYISEPYRVGIITANSGYLIKPRFFDQHIYVNYTNITKSISLVDDIWLNGHLARRNVSRYVLPSCCAQTHIGKTHALEKHLMTKNVTRRQANDRALYYFKDYWERDLFYKPNGVNHPKRAVQEQQQQTDNQEEPLSLFHGPMSLDLVLHVQNEEQLEQKEDGHNYIQVHQQSHL
ncbi:unnamed protein product [Didymodactylos carnosus]|uniref:Uncharacterized protein n=1 Tax=Didymodactylos carnosus TaxID=1234261 RepID=A0A815T7R1_9BILA|nr:unnamed protein product [Didymodactylos carnosus]CAF1500065.1 unnamed protein product [Didymodactylos carnosus]CAF3678546.1 unnamed protein product [Didymodactylos carnosus]CAF4361874.1 unnamed protein product [Didymodactylos carnosus]